MADFGLDYGLHTFFGNTIKIAVCMVFLAVGSYETKSAVMIIYRMHSMYLVSLLRINKMIVLLQLTIILLPAFLRFQVPSCIRLIEHCSKWYFTHRTTVYLADYNIWWENIPNLLRVTVPIVIQNHESMICTKWLRQINTLLYICRSVLRQD